MFIKHDIKGGPVASHQCCAASERFFVPDQVGRFLTDPISVLTGAMTRDFQKSWLGGIVSSAAFGPFSHPRTYAECPPSCGSDGMTRTTRRSIVCQAEMVGVRNGKGKYARQADNP